MFLPDTIDELKIRIKDFIKFSNEGEKFETKWDDSSLGLPLMASRYFRTPVNPFFWLSIVNADVSYEKLQKEKEQS